MWSDLIIYRASEHLHWYILYQKLLPKRDLFLSIPLKWSGHLVHYVLLMMDCTFKLEVSSKAVTFELEASSTVVTFKLEASSTVVTFKLEASSKITRDSQPRYWTGFTAMKLASAFG